MNDIEYLKKYVSEERLKESIKRYENGEPIQYIIGNVEFYGYKINVDKNVLIPRFETEELVENSIKLINKYFNNKISILEIGTGSGCISIALKKELNNIDITATDISKSALEIAKNNAKTNDVDINFINTNLFDGIEYKFDCIISNPPYISKEEEIMDIVYNNEPHEALFAKNNGLYFYEEILRKAKEVLKDKYLICFEIGMTQGEKVREYANKYLNKPNIVIKKDMQGRDRMVFIHNFE